MFCVFLLAIKRWKQPWQPCCVYVPSDKAATQGELGVEKAHNNWAADYSMSSDQHEYLFICICKYSTCIQELWCGSTSSRNSLCSFSRWISWGGNMMSLFQLLVSSLWRVDKSFNRPIKGHENHSKPNLHESQRWQQLHKQISKVITNISTIFYVENCKENSWDLSE